MNILLNELIAGLNIVMLFVTSLLTLLFYAKSVGPAALEQKIGEIAYQKCARYRRISGIFQLLVLVSYVIYFLFPLTIFFLPRFFPWEWWISIVIGVIIAIPSGYLMWRAVKDAGEEMVFPKKEHTMYGGIYEKMRHPGAVGEAPLGWVFAFLLNSPFLLLYSFIWVPIFYIMCKIEERDLVIRYGDAYKEYLKKTPFFISLRKKRSNNG